MGVGIRVSLKIPFGKRRGFMKFPVAPELMRVEVSTVFLSPCSTMGRHMILLFKGATSTLSMVREEDVEAASLLKNPVLFVYRG